MAEADPRKPALYNVHDAKTQLSRLLDRARAGEEIVIAKAGVPVAKLVPFDTPVKQRRQPGGLEHLPDVPNEVWFAPLPEEELAAWEAIDRSY